MVDVKREEATVVIAIDVSRSMKAKDIPPTRLGAAQRAAKEFLADVPEKFRVGVVSFATRAVVGVAPTDDRKLVEDAIDRLKPGEGTAVGDAVVLSARLGRTKSGDDGPPPPRAVILISDGARDGGRLAPQEAARRARQLRVPVYTVLLGTPNGVVEETLVGGFRRQIRVPPSAETLRQISQISGGKALAATDVEGLRRVHQDLASRLGTRKEEREVGDWFAGGAAAFLVAGGALSALWLKRVP
jgi:Ca-activated chloride channel family protein